MPGQVAPQTAWLPELTYVGGRFERGLAVVTDDRTGRVVGLTRAGGQTREDGRARARVVRLAGRALLPGMANAHSHAFQRVIRGRTEYRTAARDSFWTWREQMYSAATRLSPEDIYDASRMAFLEMALSGITSVGEFHYLHHDASGAPYDDPNLLSKQVVRAASDVGIRIALLRVAYARAGFDTPPDARQSRFITDDAETFLKHLDSLRTDLARDYPTSAEEQHGARAEEFDDARAEETDDAGETSDAASLRAAASLRTVSSPRGAASLRGAASAWAGVAPHSIRAVPLDFLRAVGAHARAARLPVHMHVAEQPAENEACRREHGRTPVRLLADEGLLDRRFTAVHAVHVTEDEARALAAANVCACPTTERNLGDGVVPADLLFAAGARVSLGTDSHTQIDLLEDARELEYHLRLQQLARAVLAPQDPDARGGAHDDERRGVVRGVGGRNDEHSSDERNDDERSSNDDERGDSRAGGVRAPLAGLAARLFECATANGARGIGLAGGGELGAGAPADFFTVDLADPSIAGARADDLLPAVVFSLSRAAVRETVVGGRLVVESGRHRAQEEIVSRFRRLQEKLWGGARTPGEREA